MNLRPGEELAPFVRPAGLETWNRFAAVNDEFVDIHMDDAAGRAAGYSGAFGMGNLQWAYLHNLLRDWLPAEGRIVELACRFRRASERGRVTSYWLKEDQQLPPEARPRETDDLEPWLARLRKEFPPPTPLDDL